MVSFLTTESRMVSIYQGLRERGNWGVKCSMGTEFQVGIMKKFWSWIMVMVAQQWECTSCHRMFKMVNFVMHILPRNIFLKKGIGLGSRDGRVGILGRGDIKSKPGRQECVCALRHCMKASGRGHSGDAKG